MPERRAAVIRAAVVVVALFLAWWAASGSAARWLTALRVLDDLRQAEGESWLERSTAAPAEGRVRLGTATAGFAADVYRPAAGGSPIPMLLVPGAVARGKDDPRVAPFARMLARAGFTVVVPDLPSMRRVRVHPEQVSGLAAAHEGLCANPELAPHGRAGIFGISYAGGIALLVAMDPAHAGRVPWVATVGAYADLDSAARFLATGRVFEGRRARRVTIDPYGRLVFVRTYLEFVHDLADRSILESIIERRSADPDADIGRLVDALGPEGRLVVDLFEGEGDARVSGLLARLPAALAQRMDDLSPVRRDFSRLRARLYLVHDVDDGIFPVTESARLARMARGHVPVRFVRLDALQHVNVQPWRDDPWGFLTRDLPEAVELAAWWAALLRERDR